MKSKSNILFLLLFILLINCNPNKYKTEEYDCDYSNCQTSEPILGNLNIKLTVDEKNKEVPLYLYRGYFEDNIIVDTFFAENDEININANLNTLYTIVAEYYKNEDTILVFDSNTIEAFSVAYCDSFCWTVKKTSLNVKLKF